jgi:hypothetical protein
MFYLETAKGYTEKEIVQKQAMKALVINERH